MTELQHDIQYHSEEIATDWDKFIKQVEADQRSVLSRELFGLGEFIVLLRLFKSKARDLDPVDLKGPTPFHTINLSLESRNFDSLPIRLASLNIVSDNGHVKDLYKITEVFAVKEKAPGREEYLFEPIYSITWRPLEVTSSITRKRLTVPFDDYFEPRRFLKTFDDQDEERETLNKLGLEIWKAHLNTK